MASSGSFSTNSYGSGNYNRYLVFEWSVQSQSTTNNTTTISYTLKGAGGNTTSWQMSGNFKLIIDGQTVYSSATRIQLKNGTLVKSGTFTMWHDSSGNRSFSAYAEAGINAVAVNCTGSGSWSLPQIARYPVLQSGQDFTDEGNPTLTFTNTAKIYPIRVKLEAGGDAQLITKDIDKSSTSYTFNLTEAERNLLRSKCPNSNTLTVVETVCAMSGNTELSASYKNYTMTIVNANPTFNVAYKDTNSAIVAVTGNDQLIVQSKSTLQINITNATALKSASLRTATCVLNGTTYSGNITGSSYTFNIGALDISSNATAEITVTDSRGNSTTQNLTIQMIPYYSPSAIITYERANNYYSPTTVNVDANYASVNGANSVTIKVRYKKTTDSTWSSYVTFQDNVSQVLQLDNEYAWDLQTVITDLYSTVTYNMVVSRGVPIVYFDRLKNSTGFNCFPLDEYSVEINNVPVNRNIITYSLTANITSLSVNTYTRAPMTSASTLGTRLTANNGNIVVGKGVSKLLVSAQMTYIAESAAGIRYLRIVKNNSVTNDNSVAWAMATVPAGARHPIYIPPTLIDVQENDVISLYYYTPKSDDTILGTAFSSSTTGTLTFITAEVVG